MKVIAIILICAVLITVGVVAVKLQSSEGDKNQEYLRIQYKSQQQRQHRPKRQIQSQREHCGVYDALARRSEE